jgi:hypothetical protein
VYPFATFEAAVMALDRALRVGGALVMVNTNYRFEDTAAWGRYEVAEESARGCNGLDNVQFNVRSARAGRAGTATLLMRLVC